MAGSCNVTRTLAAQVLADWIDTDPTGVPDDDWLIIGDLNSYDQEDPISALAARFPGNRAGPRGQSPKTGSYSTVPRAGTSREAPSRADLTPDLRNLDSPQEHERAQPKGPVARTGEA